MTLARRAAIGVALVWLAAAIVLLIAYRHAYLDLAPSDGDDYMRLAEVRDWLNGQSWFDVSQHRMNPPAGTSMHWSRLVDLPLAAVILLARPIFGNPAAESAALALVPLLTLGLVMAIAARLAARLHFGAGADKIETPLFGAALALCSGYILCQLGPSRIDHHGWQIAASGGAVLVIFARDPRRGGLIAGAAMAIGLAISLEGLALAAALGGLLGLRWAWNGGDEAERFAAFATGLALTSLLLAVGVRGGEFWSGRWCDVMTPGHLAAFGAAAAGALFAWRFGRGWRLPVRAAFLAAVGIAGGVTFIGIAPRCLANPFSQMDPLARQVWYLNVNEGLPAWRQSWLTIVDMVYFPCIGLIGAALAWRKATADGAKRDWTTIIVLGLAALVVAILIRRAAGTAHLLAIPGALALMAPLRARAARFTSSAARAIGAVASFIVASPLVPIYAGLIVPAAAEAKPAAPLATGIAACDTRCTMQRIAQLPPSNLLASLDAGPAVIAFTRHTIVASDYHRGDKAIAEVIRAFTGPPGDAEETVRRRRIGYVLIVPQSGETQVYRDIAPKELMAHLAANRPPAWLTPVPLGGSSFRMWRVVPARLPPPHR